MSGTLAGVHDGMPWAVDIASATASGHVFAGTLSLVFVPGFCSYENSRGPLHANTTAVTGTYGTAAVTGVDIDGELQYLRATDKAVVAIAGLGVTLHTAAGDVVTVPGDQFAGGPGTWTVTSGAVPEDCTSLAGHAPMGAHVHGVMALTSQPSVAG